jgi:hypothetical protein
MVRMKQTTTALVCLIIVAAIGAYFYKHHRQSTTNTVVLTGCRAQSFSIGSSGPCVKDIQTMTDYMETAGLTECPFNKGKVIPVNGIYNSVTVTQVKAVQTWANCYYSQEGMNSSVSTNGKVDNGTWIELCDYAYSSPKESGNALSSLTSASIAAGVDAQC